MNRTPLSTYKFWLKKVSEYYGIPESKIIGRSQSDIVCTARRTFYYLCFKDHIDLYELSQALGKNRTTIMSTLSRAEHYRDKNAERIIHAQVTAEERKLQTQESFGSEEREARCNEVFGTIWPNAQVFSRLMVKSKGS